MKGHITADFKVGDIVRLKSGGPKMTISSTANHPHLYCYWFQTDQYKNQKFLDQMLEKVDQESSVVMNNPAEKSKDTQQQYEM